MNSPTLPTRLTIDKLRSILDTLDINRLRFFHSLFRGSIMDEIDYEFIDEWQIDEYYDCAYDWFSDGSRTIPYKLNGYVGLILLELQTCSPVNYRKAMGKIKLWLKCDLYDFISDKEPELTAALDAVINGDNQKKVVVALAPFLADASTDIQYSRFEAAASLLFMIMESLGKVKQHHKSWFPEYWENTRSSDMDYFLGHLHDLYCCLRGRNDLPVNMPLQLDIRLKCLNDHIEIFGNVGQGIYSDSPSFDMTASAGEQLTDYTCAVEEVSDFVAGISK